MAGEDPTALIKSLLSQSSGPQGLGTPFSGLPFSGLPQFAKAPMFDTSFPQPQARGQMPETPVAPMPEIPRVERIRTGEGLGERFFDKSLAELGNKSPKVTDPNMKKIMDALAASKNALATLYGTPTPSAAQPKAGTMQDENGLLEQYRYNLGNIRASDIGWDGKTTPYKGFESFESPEAGAIAMFKNLSSYAKSSPDMTIADAINKWAPPSENDTKNYVNFVTSNLSIPPNTKLADILKDPLMAASLMYTMGRMEHGQNLPKVFTPTFLSQVISGV